MGKLSSSYEVVIVKNLIPRPMMVHSEEETDGSPDGPYLRTSCAVCTTCRFRPKLGQCDFGGPFLGYTEGA